jgi:hypothetical protein
MSLISEQAKKDEWSECEKQLQSWQSKGVVHLVLGETNRPSHVRCAVLDSGHRIILPKTHGVTWKCEHTNQSSHLCCVLYRNDKQWLYLNWDYCMGDYKQSSVFDVSIVTQVYDEFVARYLPEQEPIYQVSEEVFGQLMLRHRAYRPISANVPSTLPPTPPDLSKRIRIMCDRDEKGNKKTTVSLQVMSDPKPYKQMERPKIQWDGVWRWLNWITNQQVYYQVYQGHVFSLEAKEPKSLEPNTPTAVSVDEKGGFNQGVKEMSGSMSYQASHIGKLKLHTDHIQLCYAKGGESIVGIMTEENRIIFPGTMSANCSLTTIVNEFRHDFLWKRV